VTLTHHDHGLGYSGRGFIEAARALVEGAALDADKLATRAFTCATCGNCEQACPIGLRPAQIGRALRAELHALEATPAPVATARDALINYGHAYGDKPRWQAPVEPLSDTPAWHYFPGCAAAYIDHSEAAATFALLKAWSGGGVVIEASCCGAPFAEWGYVREAAAYTSAVAAQAQDLTLIVSGYECQRQLRTTSNIKVQSVLAWCAEQLELHSQMLSWRKDVARLEQLMLVESCQLKAARHVESDEHLLLRLLAPLKLTIVGKSYPNPHAPCCGASGGMPLMQAHAAQRMASARLPERGMVLCLDPRCAAHMRTAASNDTVEVLGFASFVERYCERVARLAS
jgi:Fe-S oxidoreductase